MQLFSTAVLPIDKILIGQNVSLTEILVNAKEKPAHFALELFAFTMMIIGTVVTCNWAYETGKAVGTLIG